MTHLIRISQQRARKKARQTIIVRTTSINNCTAANTQTNFNIYENLTITGLHVLKCHKQSTIPDKNNRAAHTQNNGLFCEAEILFCAFFVSFVRRRRHYCYVTV